MSKNVSIVNNTGVDLRPLSFELVVKWFSLRVLHKYNPDGSDRIIVDPKQPIQSKENVCQQS